MSTLNSQQKHSFTTYPTGTLVDLVAPTPAMIHLEDIAHSLSMQCRYNGHLREHYNVAQHSVYVLQQVTHCSAPALFGSAEEKLRIQVLALLHDAHEMATGDIISPTKGMLKGVKDLEMRLDYVIFKRFQIQPTPLDHAVVREHDMRVFAAESVMLRGWGRKEFAALQDPTLYDRRALNVDGSCWSAKKAKKRFLEEARKLGLK